MKFVSLMLLSAWILVGCSNTITPPMGLSELMVPPRDNVKAESINEIGWAMEVNGAQCLDDKAKLRRWQEWWKGQNNGG